jgi:hypothetical protein
MKKAQDQISYPLISLIFFVLAALCFLGGIVLSFNLSPGKPDYGYEWKTAAYIPSIISFVAGFVQTAFLAAIGQGLYYLHRIAENTLFATTPNSKHQNNNEESQQANATVSRNKDVESYSEASEMYEQAEVLRQQGKIDESNNIYETIINNYPSSKETQFSSFRIKNNTE